MKTLNIQKAMEIFNINIEPTTAEDVLTAEDKAMTQEVLANCEAIEEAMAVKNLINNFWTIVAEDSKKALEQWNNVFDKEEEPVEDDFIASMESYIEEAERLHTSELVFECNRNIAIYESIMEDKELISIYGNKTIKRHREVESALNKIPTGCDKSLVQLTMDAKGCTYSQAVSKLAQKFNINYNKETWFKGQLEIIEHNRSLINNPTDIIIKYPQLWNKMKESAHMKKYFIFLLDLMKTQLEQKGVSQRGKMPLIASASCGFISSALRVGYKTAYINMNNLTMFGATKKLTNDEVKAIDESRYESILALSGGVNETITTYELILWTEEVLKSMNDMVIEKQRTRATREGQCRASLEAIGCGNVINKSNKELSAEDKANIASLKKWARKKVYEKGGCGFITQEDWNSRFNNKSNKNTIWAKKHTRDMYETIVMAELGLTYEYVSKELKSVMNSKKLDKLDSGKVWVPVNKADKLNKYNN